MTSVPSNPAPTIPRKTIAIGIALMVIAVGLFASMNMLVKVIGNEYHPFEAVFFRNTIAAVFVIPFIMFSGGLGTLKTKRPLGHGLRALAGVGGNACFFTAYQYIALADGMAIAMSVPIFATLFAVPLLGEKVDWRRWAAIMVGFGGVLVALDPTGSIGPGSYFALTGTVFWALTIIFVRKLSTTESPYTIVFYYMITGSVIAACVMPWVWVTPSQSVLWLYLATGVVGALGQIAMTFSLKLAPASVVSPFEYTQIVWALIFDLAIWGAVPAAATLLGAGIVIVTGLYIFRREAQGKK
ncbi:MAG: DMT family transporter [Rhodospirillales bacterium]|nr:DMT family transporter [Alphaproteobacteria bacterium]MBL6928105.1 DMT family transporter [Rhodospirillales bacterium]